MKSFCISLCMILMMHLDHAYASEAGMPQLNPEFWGAVVKPGRILFEMGGDEITEEIAKEAMRLAQYKLPVKTKFISLEEDLNKGNYKPAKTPVAADDSESSS